MYLVFADKDIVRDTQIVDNILPILENGDCVPDYDSANWNDIEADVLLGTYEEKGRTIAEVIEQAAMDFETDSGYLYAIKVDSFQKTYLSQGGEDYGFDN